MGSPCVPPPARADRPRWVPPGPSPVAPRTLLTIAHLVVAGHGTGLVTGPFAGESVSCRSCHLSDEAAGVAGLPGDGLSLFADFAERSPLPGRDGRESAIGRHSPALVEVAGFLEGESPGLLHWDGEFVSLDALVAETFVGKNFGWTPAERAVRVPCAVAPVAPRRAPASARLLPGKRRLLPREEEEEPAQGATRLLIRPAWRGRRRENSEIQRLRRPSMLTNPSAITRR